MARAAPAGRAGVASGRHVAERARRRRPASVSGAAEPQTARPACFQQGRGAPGDAAQRARGGRQHRALRTRLTLALPVKKAARPARRTCGNLRRTLQTGRCDQVSSCDHPACTGLRLVRACRPCVTLASCHPGAVAHGQDTRQDDAAIGGAGRPEGAKVHAKVLSRGRGSVSDTQVRAVPSECVAWTLSECPPWPPFHKQAPRQRRPARAGDGPAC
jgi:hypothetical protein